MKKLINTAFVYTIVALLAGAFYREFTKFMNYSEGTSLAFVHTHLMVLGAVFFLIIALFAASTDLLLHPKFERTIRLYHFSVIAMVGMMFVRGITQIMMPDVSRAIDFSISGLAGLSHICMLVSFILLFRELKAIQPTAQ